MIGYSLVKTETLEYLRYRVRELEACLSEVAAYNERLNSGEGQPWDQPKAPDGDDYNAILGILGV